MPKLNYIQKINKGLLKNNYKFTKYLCVCISILFRIAYPVSCFFFSLFIYSFINFVSFLIFKIWRTKTDKIRHKELKDSIEILYIMKYTKTDIKNVYIIGMNLFLVFSIYISPVLIFLFHLVFNLFSLVSYSVVDQNTQNFTLSAFFNKHIITLQQKLKHCSYSIHPKFNNITDLRKIVPSH